MLLLRHSCTPCVVWQDQWLDAPTPAEADWWCLPDRWAGYLEQGTLARAQAFADELALMEDLLGDRQPEELVSVPKNHDPELRTLMRVLSSLKSIFLSATSPALALKSMLPASATRTFG